MTVTISSCKSLGPQSENGPNRWCCELIKNKAGKYLVTHLSDCTDYFTRKYTFVQSYI